MKLRPRLLDVWDFPVVFLLLRVMLATNVRKEFFEVAYLCQPVPDVLCDLLEREILVQALNKKPEMQVRTPAALLALDCSTERVGSSSAASHGFCAAPKGILARPI